MATSCPIKFHTAAKPGVKRKSDNDAQNKNNEKYEANRKRLFLSSWDTERHWLHRIFFQSDIWADIYVVFMGPSHFLSAKPIKPTVFKNSAMTIDHFD
jgi:hypothetical protein